MKARDRYFPFSGKGLSTTAYGPAAQPDEWDVLQDVEVDHGDSESRGGRVLLARTTAASNLLAFDGVNDRMDIPSALTLGAASLNLYFTLELLFKTTNLASDRFVLGRYDASRVGVTVKHTTTNTVVVTLIDGGGIETLVLTFTGVPVGTLCGLQITRNNTAVSAYLNGTTQTGTMVLTTAPGRATLGADNGASFYRGTIDYFRGWTVVRSTQADLYYRRMNPRHRDCLFDYVLVGDAATDVVDRGRFQYHAQTQGAVAFNDAPLAVNPSPVQALAYSQRKNGTREVIAVVGGTAYAATVT